MNQSWRRNQLWRLHDSGSEGTGNDGDIEGTGKWQKVPRGRTMEIPGSGRRCRESGRRPKVVGAGNDEKALQSDRRRK